MDEPSKQASRGPEELTMLRFDPPGPADAVPAAEMEALFADEADRRRLAGARVVAGRLYEVADAAPRWLAWFEAEGTGPIPPGDGEAARFRLVRDVGDATVWAPGGRTAPYLYIVHTDIPDDVVEEYNHWYDSEHLPRLVTVPGVLRARRYAALAGGPRYLTAYDLADRDAFESPAGLVARKTPWTARMRGLFFNTRRLMGVLRLVPDAPG